MDCQIEYRDGRLHACGEMTIYAAATMKAGLLAGIDASDADVQLDMSKVTELDTCGLQILLLAQRLAKEDGRRLIFVEPSAIAREVLALCGLNGADRLDTKPAA
jgi:anti-anti-sigma factor